MTEKITTAMSERLTSRKFLGALFFSISWTLLMLAGLYRLEGILQAAGEGGVDQLGVASLIVTLLMVMSGIKGFVEVIFLGGQTAVDAYSALGKKAISEAGSWKKGEP